MEAVFQKMSSFLAPPPCDLSPGNFNKVLAFGKVVNRTKNPKGNKTSDQLVINLPEAVAMSEV